MSSVTSYVSETVWSGSNGGFSIAFSRPSYQDDYQISSQRGVPDLAANADSKTGYVICYSSLCHQIGGAYLVIFFNILKAILSILIILKGTSAVSPLYAALTARLMQINGKATVQANFKNGGYYKYLKYNDITSGSNDCYKSGIQWDPVTGLGSYSNSIRNASSYTPTEYKSQCNDSNQINSTKETLNYLIFLCFIINFL